MSGHTIMVNGRLDDLGEALRQILGTTRGDAAPEPQIAVISDENVAGLYLDRLMRSLAGNGFTAFPLIIRAGEEHKNGAAYLELLEKMSGIPLSRTDIAVCLGGGVTGDMGGFAAATYMRGIPVVQAPTTLLAMVDSAIGGKTGIDLSAGKNLAGAFHEPLMVYTDTELLATLPGRELRSGMAEVVKYGVLCGEPLMAMIEDMASGEDIPAAIPDGIISLCQKAKLEFVEGDLTDKGKRQLLNLGHTIGHAAEKASGYRMSHGEAVAAGMAEIMRIFGDLGVTSPECRERVLKLLQSLGLPAEVPFTGEELFDIIKNDKKRKGSFIDLAVPEDVGRCVLKRMPVEELERLLR